MSKKRSLEKYISAPAAWAFSIGTSVGWGSLVVTANTYLAQAGPLGSVLGLVIGTVVMLIISVSYGYLMKAYPEAGGAYSYTKESFGYDYGFLTAWFLSMTYLAVLWANVTSLPLFARIFMGDVFKAGRMYTIFNYDVYFGEVVLSLLAMAVIGILCMKNKELMSVLMTILAVVFTVGIAVCFIAAIFKSDVPMRPLYIEDSSALSQIVKIAVISPWAFIGFENISHFTEEFTFERSRIDRILIVSVISSFLLYVFITLLSVTAYPPSYDSWISYIRDINNLSGIEALPAFYAANVYLGTAGVWILMLSLLALVISSLIGNITALSRLFYAMAKDHVLPARVYELNGRNIPSNAVILIMILSIPIPFLGRTAIGWIVDITTIGATIIYGLVAASAMRTAGKMGNRREYRTGLAGIISMAVFGTCFLIPNFVARGGVAKETFLLFIVWSVFGFLYFRYTLHMDKEHRFGSSAAVWVALLSLVLFVSFVWMRQSMMASDDELISNVKSYYEDHGQGNEDADGQYIISQIVKQSEDTTRAMIMALGMFAFVMLIMLTNHSYMNRLSKENEKRANTDSLTGARNKQAFMTREILMDESIDEGTAREFAVVVCDLNGLKKINDTLGHKAGDEYICAACRMISEIFQNSHVYRIGGDEFVVILTGRDYMVRDDLMKLLHDRAVNNITEGGVVISGGISDYKADEDMNFHAVFARADILMYEEKKLLKSMGAVTRDEESEAEKRAREEYPGYLLEEQIIINVRRSVLVVDDERINQELLGAVLEDSYEVLYAFNGIEALEQINEHRDEIALIMLDLIMPRMSGLELLGRLREDNELRLIPVIILTSDQNSEVDCLRLGAADFIIKPYPEPDIIRARVNKCIELAEDRNIIQSTERDNLTKLFNIDYFIRYVNMLDKHYQDLRMDAIVVDLNRFHMVNERYGKEYGDKVLREVGERVREVARWLGGVGCRQVADTFLIYAPHYDNYEEILEKLSEAVAGEDDDDKKIRLRLGIYPNVDRKLDIERRFDRAKLASDNAKGNYDKSIGIYDSGTHESLLFKERLLEDFRTSLRQECFVVYFQPKFDIRPQEPLLSSAEALVRWNHPELGMISPGVFIPLLEENGLILDLDRYVWERTARHIKEWKEKYGFTVPVSVNVSRIDMLMPNLKDIFNSILEENGLTEEDIILEITESAYTGESDQVISTARELRGMGMGFRIEMDDFGTGYSSLGMLSNMPIDVLKLDMSFIRNAFGENKDMRMIELIIDIADYLNVPVVAEGVETKEQYLTLKAMGCDLVQGYYFSKPLPHEEFEHYLVERSKRGNNEIKKVRKNMSITKALTSEYESIFYIDKNTDYYIEFYAGPEGELQLRTDGESFFKEGLNKLKMKFDPDDEEGLNRVLSKEALIAWALGDEPEDITIRRNGGTISIRALNTRNSDENHIVIGVTSS